MGGATTLGLGFIQMDHRSVPNRVFVFLKLKLHQFPDAYEVIFSEYKAQIHVQHPTKLATVVLRP